MLHIANPIYDIVFKYLMEDERIVKTILSALLKKEVVEAEKATGTLAKGQYHDIYLDEAVELPENGVYVGYTFTTKKDTYAVPFMGTAVENGCWMPVSLCLFSRPKTFLPIR